ncbi:uncharacterized protein [Argopecten irradians]|uniref:uncharacterized protein n=1 Tax=Argopecten irradians TaxID=31199 RepID=UPI0037189632
MWKRLVRDYGIAVKRNDVMKIMKEINPHATDERRSHRLQRRVYRLKGPNYVWHVDGYDKLKPFGFCIHGCIDGYSRKVLWFEVASTNNNPSVIAKYYLDCLMAQFHGLFSRHEEFYVWKEYIKPTNRGVLGDPSETGRALVDKFFKDIRDCGLFDMDHPVVKECLQFCFMEALQTDLDRIAKHWNSHDIRQQKKYSELPSGKPDVLFFVPELNEGHNFKTDIDTEDLNACIELYGEKKPKYSKTFKELVNVVKPNAIIPIHPDEGLRLFVELNIILQEYL